MRRSINTIGSVGSDYSSLYTWEGDHDGVEADIQVAILARQYAEELSVSLEKLTRCLATRTLFVADTGILLAYVDQGNVERLTEDWASAFEEPADRDRTDEAIDAFVEERLGVVEEDVCPEVRIIVRNMSAAFARLIAEDPNALDDLEWRHLEHTMAEVFNGLGFSVVLTPPAKDGGKDLILSCKVTTGTRTYVVEIKHWPSGKRVGPKEIRQLLNIVVRGGRAGGLIISSSGFSAPACAILASVEHLPLRTASRTAIITLCKLYATGTGRVLSPTAVWAQLTEGRWTDA